jgi:glycolate dehydrogenase FAD-binding subunit
VGVTLEIDGLKPRETVRVRTETDVADAIRGANERGEALVLVAGGTRVSVGDPVDRCDLVVDLSALRGVVEHQPDDLVATVRGGCTLAELAAALDGSRQRWPVEAGAPDRATVGGTIASAAFGPSRYRYFHPRDWVIGARVVLGDGTAVRSGGKVVKNVTGYDLTRLWSGTLGTLAAIVELTLKLTADPERTVTLQADTELAEALRVAGDLHASGLPLDAIAIASGAVADGLGARGKAALLVRIAGPASAVLRVGRAVRERVRCHDVANDVWERVTTATVDATWVARVAWPASRSAPIGFAGFDAVLYPANGTAFLLKAVDRATFRRARTALESIGGYAVLESASVDYRRAVGGAWGAPRLPLAIARALKTRLDPRAVLAPGRMPV